jgi:hypothetical protein
MADQEEGSPSERSEGVGDAGRDLAAAGVYGILPFLILPTAGYLMGLGETGIGIASLLAGCSAFFPPALLAKEGILKIAAGRADNADPDRTRGFS